MAYHGIQLTIARQKAQDQGSPAPLLRAPEAAPGLRQSRLTIATIEELDDGQESSWCRDHVADGHDGLRGGCAVQGVGRAGADPFHPPHDRRLRRTAVAVLSRARAQ